MPGKVELYSLAGPVFTWPAPAGLFLITGYFINPRELSLCLARPPEPLLLHAAHRQYQRVLAATRQFQRLKLAVEAQVQESLLPCGSVAETFGADNN